MKLYIDKMYVADHFGILFSSIMHYRNIYLNNLVKQTVLSRTWARGNVIILEGQCEMSTCLLNDDHK